MRIERTAIVALLLLISAGCSSTSDSERPDSEQPDPEQETAVPAAESFGHAAAAMPADDELPAGFSVRQRCPGGENCTSSSEAEKASLTAMTERRDDADEAELWFGEAFSFRVEYYPDSAAAKVAAADARADLAETTSGEFTIDAERRESGGFQPGQEGSGDASDYELSGWTGVEGLWEAVLTTPDGERSAPRQQAKIIVAYDRTVVTCRATRYADAGVDLARDDCRGAVSDYLDRLGNLDPSKSPLPTTVR